MFGAQDGTGPFKPTPGSGNRDKLVPQLSSSQCLIVVLLMWALACKGWRSAQAAV